MKILMAGRVIDTNQIPVCLLLDSQELHSLAALGAGPALFWAHHPSLSLSTAQSMTGLEANALAMTLQEGSYE